MSADIQGLAPDVQHILNEAREVSVVLDSFHGFKANLSSLSLNCTVQKTQEIPLRSSLSRSVCSRFRKVLRHG
jgi:hypothetical protein